MSQIELLAKIELLNKYEAMIEEMKGEADSIRNSIKAEMEAREAEEAKKAELEEMIQKLMADGVSAAEILEKLK